MKKSKMISAIYKENKLIYFATKSIQKIIKIRKKAGDKVVQSNILHLVEFFGGPGVIYDFHLKLVSDFFFRVNITPNGDDDYLSVLLLMFTFRY